MDLGHWEFSCEFEPTEWFGFVYRIIDLTTMQEYIGKKQFFFTVRKVVRGRKNRKVVKKESDWRTYTSSSAHVNAAIELKGKENFLFKIESLHKTKGSLSYAEVQTQLFEDVLCAKLDDGVTPKFYNRQIPGIKFIPPEEHSEETRIKIQHSLKTRYASNPYWKDHLTDEQKEEFLDNFYRGENHYLYRKMSTFERAQFIADTKSGKNNPMFGQTPWNKGLTFEEMHQEFAEDVRQTLREKCVSMGFKGHSHTEEQKEAWRSDERRIKRGDANGMFGKPCFYNMSDDRKAQWAANISKASKGKPKSEDHKQKIRAGLTGLKRKQVTCPHCGKTGGVNNMFRYHFDRCKFIQH